MRPVDPHAMVRPHRAGLPGRRDPAGGTRAPAARVRDRVRWRGTPDRLTAGSTSL